MKRKLQYDDDYPSNIVAEVNDPNYGYDHEKSNMCSRGHTECDSNELGYRVGSKLEISSNPLERINSSLDQLYVINRKGEREEVSFDKILQRLKTLKFLDPPLQVTPEEVARLTIQSLTNDIKTSELDNIASEISYFKTKFHLDYETFAVRIAVSNLHKEIGESLMDVTKRLWDRKVISSEVFSIISNNIDVLQNELKFDRDYKFTYVGFRTVEKLFLALSEGKPIERPQHWYMRTAVGIWGDNIPMVLKTYDLLSSHKYTHGTPTLTNASSERSQMASCYLLHTNKDEIFSTIKQCEEISKGGGGIGLNITGVNDDIVPILRIFNETVKYVAQERRRGAFAIYIEPWHIQIEDFLQLKLPNGDPERRATNLYYALWIPDLFMKRVKEGGNWTLFYPNDVSDLMDTHSKEFEALYEKYEKSDSIKNKKVVKALDIWSAILKSQVECGVPYLLYKDSANRKSNQQNLGTIKCSNLCCEIIEYTSKDEIAVCNLASISLPAMCGYSASSGKMEFDFKEFTKVIEHATRTLNKTIDKTCYPFEQAKNSNLKHRPIGLGIQGLADVFCILRIPFDSLQAKKLNKDIFETLYYTALKTSNELAIENGKPYDSFNGSPASKGQLQFDLWGYNPGDHRHNWTELKQRIVDKGLFNSLLIAPMPTCRTSQILGNTECFEPFQSNFYTRRVMIGEVIICNKYLIKHLMELNLYSQNMYNKIIANQGSIQNIKEIPPEVRKIYKTVWEISQRDLIDMAADRGVFIDQSQSMNLFLANPTHSKLSGMHFYAYEKGLKTGIYYLRSQVPAKPIQFTVPPPLKTPLPPQPPESISKHESVSTITPTQQHQQYNEENTEGDKKITYTDLRNLQLRTIKVRTKETCNQLEGCDDCSS